MRCSSGDGLFALVVRDHIILYTTNLHSQRRSVALDTIIVYNYATYLLTLLTCNTTVARGSLVLVHVH